MNEALIIGLLGGFAVGVAPYIASTLRRADSRRLDGLEGRVAMAERAILRHGGAINALADQVARIEKPGVVPLPRINREHLYAYPEETEPTIIELHDGGDE